MKIHLIHDKKTGEILHMHLSSDRELTREDILHKVTKIPNKANLDILTVDQLPEGEAFKVDPSSRKLVAEDPKKVRGLGSGAFSSTGEFPKGIKVAYKKC